MRHLCKIIAPLCIFALIGFALGGEDGDGSQFLDQLRHDDFDIRRNATERLIAMGDSARGILEKAVAGEDPQLRESASAILSKLNKAGIVILAFDRDGKPAVGAEGDLRIYNQQRGGNWNEQPSEQLTIKADGRAVLSDKVPGLSSLQFNWRKWAPARELNSNQPAGFFYQSAFLERGAFPMLVTLSKGGTIKGLIRDAAGNPVKDAQMLIYANRTFDDQLLDIQLTCLEVWGAWGWGNAQSVSGSTDAKGVVTFESIPDGLYQGIVKHESHFPALTAQVRVREGQIVDFPALTMVKKETGKITFVLKKNDGMVLKKTHISVDMERQLECLDAAERQRNGRRLKGQLNMQRQPEAPETDDNGKITLDDLRPGKYKLGIRSANATPWATVNVEVKAAQTVDLGTLIAVKTGGVKGRVLGMDGKGAQSVAVNVLTEEDAEEADLHSADWRYYNRQYQISSQASTGQDGSYDIKNLPPGRYALYITGRRGNSSVVYGVEVKEGNSVSAPDVTLKNASASAPNIKGKIELPSGKAASGASVALQGQQFNRTQRNADDNGVFVFSRDEMETAPSKLFIKSAGCKGLTVDLSDPAVNSADLKIKLEKLQFGSLRVKVVDESGAALPDATVRPYSQRSRSGQSRNTPQERRGLTNRAGEARFSGLAEGTRSLQVHREGYYLPEEPKVTIEAGNETFFTATMKRGLTVTGEVEVPSPAHLANTIVYFSDSIRPRASFVTPVEGTSTGRYEFSGLAPGDCNLSFSSPGLIDSVINNQRVTLEAETPVKQAPREKLVRPAGGVVNLGDKMSGYAATPVKPSSWDPQQKIEAQPWGAATGGIVDAAGRLEMSLSLPGPYDLFLRPPAENSFAGPYYYGNQGQRQLRKVAAGLFAGTITLSTLNAFADLKELPAQTFTVAPASGAVTLRLVCDPPLQSDGRVNVASISVSLVSSKAEASSNFTYPADFLQQNLRSTQIVGLPPSQRNGKALFAPLEGSGAVTFTNLPAGEYRMYSTLTLFQHGPGRQKEPLKPEIKLLQTFTLTDGQRLSMGTVLYPLPQETLNGVKGQDEWYNAETVDADDVVPLFNP